MSNVWPCSVLIDAVQYIETPTKLFVGQLGKHTLEPDVRGRVV